MKEYQTFDRGCTHRTLSLGGLQKVSVELAEVLAQHKGMLILNGVKELDIATASILGTFKGTLLALDGIEHMDSSAVEELRKIRGILSADSLLNEASERQLKKPSNIEGRNRFVYDSDDAKQLGLD